MAEKKFQLLATNTRQRASKSGLPKGVEMKAFHETDVATTVVVEAEGVSMTLVLDHVDGETGDQFEERVKDAVKASREAVEAISG